MNLVYFQEKAELENVVAVHVAHILAYQQERDPESGQYFYKMDPDVESIVWAREDAAGGRRRGARLPEVPQRDADGGARGGGGHNSAGIQEDHKPSAEADCQTSRVQNKGTNGFLWESFEGRIQQTLCCVFK